MKFAACRRKVCSLYSILKMEAVISTETSVTFCQTRHCYSLKVDNLHSRRAQDLTPRQILNLYSIKLEFIWAKIAFLKVKQCGLCDYHCPSYNNVLSLDSSIRNTFLACEVYGWGILINSKVETDDISCRMESEISLPLLSLHLVN